MKLIGMLSYFDESPELLRECITRLRAVGIDHLVAVDGAYDSYPGDGVSPFECFQAILDSCRGLSLSMRSPSGWSGDEVEKRNFMLEVALSIARADDWLLVVDADHFWESDEDLHSLLNGCPDTTFFARVAFTEVEVNGVPWWEPMRPLMRARRDMRLTSNHYTYVTDDGVSRILERPALGPVMDAFDLTESVRVHHGVYQRDPERRERQSVYYERRSES